MFEITVGNWIVPCRILMDNMNENFMFFVLVHKLLVGFSMVAVINGVFMKETFTVVEHDDTIMVMNKKRAARSNKKKMQLLFDTTDLNGSNSICLDEFKELLKVDAV